MDNLQIFSFLSEKKAAGCACVLVTIASVKGSSMRSVGAHMGVGADGDFIGSLSGGCIENAVVAEALDALKAGAARITRFGAGSRYIDIKLPCGGGVDIHFQPLFDDDFVDRCCKAIKGRQPFSIHMSCEETTIDFLDHWTESKFDPSAQRVEIGHWPSPKLLVLGHGAAVKSLAMLTDSLKLKVEVLSPDDRVLSDIALNGISTSKLPSPNETQDIQSDRWTAIVFLFHDHDWEIQLMKYALKQPHFYLGAMGSRKAHAFRTEALMAAGVKGDELATIHAPIGLFHSTRDPDALALSALSEVIKSYHQYDFAQYYG